MTTHSFSPSPNPVVAAEQERLPRNLFDFAWFEPGQNPFIRLADMAEKEEWNYTRISEENIYPDEHQGPNENDHQSKTQYPILHRYIKGTYARLAEEGKIAFSENDEHACFDTGLVTSDQEPIYAFFDINTRWRTNQSDLKWYFREWLRSGERRMVMFPIRPQMANYIIDPERLVFDTDKEFSVNVEHIINERRDRFPAKYQEYTNFQLRGLLDHAINHARGRAKRNYKTAIPQFRGGEIHLLLPLCLENPDHADLALAVENQGGVYRATTILHLDWAYANARLLARPDRDWLQP